MNNSVHIADGLALGLYGALLLYVGFRLWRKQYRDTDEFLLAGRRLTLPAFVMTLVTTWYGGILGVGEYTYRYGLANWFVFGLPYYIAAVIFALFFAHRARRTKYHNLPDQLYHAYGPKAARGGALIVFLMTVPAGYVLMAGVILAFIFGISVELGVLLGTALSVVYVYLGGFHSVVRTDKFQFTLMYLGFILLLIYLWYEFGSPAAMWAQLPDTHTQPTGGQSIWAIIVWYFIALATLIEPTFYQRCYAAKSESTARRGIFTAIGFWLVFDCLTTITGLYAVILYPQLTDPVQTFPQLAGDFLPIGIRGLFWVSLLAVIMSTVDSYTFVAAVTGGRDLILGKRPGTDPDAERRWTRYALPVVALLAMAIAVFFRSVVDIWYIFGTIGTPALLLPVITTFFPHVQFRPRGALLNMILAGGLALAWEIANMTSAPPSLVQHIPAIYPGLAVSLLIWLIDLKSQPSSQPNDPSRKGGI